MEKQKASQIKVLFFILIALNAIFALYSASSLAHESHTLDKDKRGNSVTIHESSDENIRLHEQELHQLEVYEGNDIEDDYELLPDYYFNSRASCTKASKSQIQTVNSGNAKRSDFQNTCLNATGNSPWCSQVERPNPQSKSIFYCTYGSQQPHLLIHPTSSTWKNAVTAIQLIKKLSNKGICVSRIYNWWRPEPYNANVGGAAGRHPFGTSVDVSFCSNSDAIRGFDELCKYRKQGAVRALGYYGSTGVHIGVGDSVANTWGRNCK